MEKGDTGLAPMATRWVKGLGKRGGKLAWYWLYGITSSRETQCREMLKKVGRDFLVLGKQFTEGNGPWSISV